MDLETISSQMNSVILKHQMVVKELKSDPQNPVLLKKLTDLQCEIRSLNERQKQVVAGLRKNLEKPCPNTCSTNATACPATSQSPRSFISIQETPIPCSQKIPVVNNKLTTTVVTKPISNCINTVRQTVPPMINNIATPTATTFTFKAPMGTVVLPNCSTTASTLLTTKVAEHQKMHPVLVVPSPSNRTADGPQTGVLLNLVPPIRVPQYTPPTPSLPRPITCQKNAALNNCIPIAVASTSATFQSRVNSHLTSSSESPPATSCEKLQPNHSSNNIDHKLRDEKKIEYMRAIGLYTHEYVAQLMKKKNEKKHRYPANMVKDDKIPISTQKRKKGRPRLESKPVICATNGVSPANDVKPEVLPPQNNMVYSITTNATPVNNSTAVVNGIHKPNLNSEEGKNVEQMLSGLCIICTQPGDLVKCDTCAKQQHLGCMQPPLIARPQVPWQCSECQSRTVSLAVVQNFEIVKAAKEDEKKKLLKKSLELRLKRSQIDARLTQLKDYSGKQKNRQSEVQGSVRGSETLVDRINGVLGGVKMCS